MAQIELRNITKTYDKDNHVIKDLNLVIPNGSFTVLVGPSGCGKSTTLRMIAGLEDISSGDLYIDDRLVNDVEPGDRNIAMVFQNYALYPTMTVKENIEFGLINAKVPKKEREERINKVCETVELLPYLNRKPSELSGGQRQRVALARAIVKEPKVFLMDEPLSNLDAKLRNQMRTDLIELHKKLKATFVYVTHDQIEAMSMATNIVLMNKGKIMQVASSEKLYEEPENLFAAKFIGNPTMNVLLAKELKNIIYTPDNVKYIGFRPSNLKLMSDMEEKDKCIHFNGEVLTREFFGNEIIYRVKTDFGIISFISFKEKSIEISQNISLSVKKNKIYYFDYDEKRIVI